MRRSLPDVHAELASSRPRVSWTPKLAYPRCMRGVLLIGALMLSGCVLDRSGTRPDRRGQDAAGLDAALDAGSTDIDSGPDSGPDRGDGGGLDGGGPGDVDGAAPSECAAGEMRDVTCGECGSQVQQCDAGRWVSIGACAEAPPCTSGATETQSEACGRCGTRERTRSCGGCAGWSPYGAWGTCTGEGACMPGATRARETGCGSCGGTRTVTETCDGSCTWQPASSGACVEAVCVHPISTRRVCDGDDGVFGCSGGGAGLRFCRCDGSTGEFASCREVGC